MAVEKVKWGKGRKEAFRGWFHDQLHNTIGDRGALEDKWADDIVQWRARVVGDGTSDVPFVGASDIEMPLTAIHTDPIYADFMQTLHLPKNFWTVTELKPGTVERAGPLEEFYRVVEQKDIRMRQVNKRCLMDVIIHGTGIMKDIILHENKKVRDYNEAGEIEEVTKLKFQPSVQHVPLQDFFIPANSWEIDPDAPVGGAPWVAHRFKQLLGQFVVAKDGEEPFLPSYDKEPAAVVQEWVRTLNTEDEVRQTIQQEDEYEPYREDKVQLYEVWARFDTDGDGIEEDVVVTWHQETQSMLRTIYNPYMHGERPFEKVEYMPGFGFYGMGVAEIDEWAQRSVSRMLNSAVDAAFLSNSVMLSVPRGMGVDPDTPIYPGKLWYTGPNEKVSPVQMGSPHPQLFQLVSGFMQWAEQRTSVSDLRQGDVSGLPSRTPASTVLQVLNEGNKRFDMVLSNMREGAYKRIGFRLLQNLIQISRDDPRYIALAVQSLGEKDGSVVAEVLRGQVHTVEANFGIDLTATSSQANKENDKQATIFLAQQMAQMYPQLLQYAQLLAQASGDQQLVLAAVQAAMNGTTELMRRLVETHDIQNPEKFIPQAAAAAPPAPPGPAAAAQPALGAPGAALGGSTGAAPFAQGPAAILSLLGVGS